MNYFDWANQAITQIVTAQSGVFVSLGQNRRCPDRSGKLLTAIRAHFMPPLAGWLAAIRRGSLSGPRDLGSP